MSKALVLAALAAAMPIGPAMAGGDALSGGLLHQAVAGKTMLIETAYGAFPISYRTDGTMTGQARTLIQYTGSSRDNGIWWVIRDKLCQRWSKWLDGKSYCVTLRQEGRTMHWTSDDGQSGTATFTH